MFETFKINDMTYKKIAGNIILISIPNSFNEVNVANGCTAIYEKAFANCSKLETVSIPSSVKRIGYKTFCNCTNLKKVNLSEGLEYIDDSAFAGCTNLKEITIPNTIHHISLIAFEKFNNRNNSLEKIILPKQNWHLPGIEDFYISNKNIISDSKSLDELLDEGKSLRELSKIYNKKEIER